jgi:UDP-N-acetylmuramyl pentapeptide phosphotransferase/UDP-N-acetylglucosamine-1-phosphate transferase
MTISIISFLFSACLAFLVAYFGKKVVPSKRCSHEIPTPSAGGISFWGVFCLGYVYYAHHGEWIMPLPCFFAIVGLGLISLYDDFFPLCYRTRLIVHLSCAALVLYSGLIVQMPLLGKEIFGLDIILTIILVVGLINACNFFDGINGLLSGCTLLLLLYTLLVDIHDTSPILFIFMPALLGFYIFNFPKARLFMGDTGSTCIGLLLAIISLKAQNHYNLDTHTALIHKRLIYTLTPMMFVWFDVFITLLRRLTQGRSIVSPWRDYLFHHLYDMGYAHVKISLMYYLTVILMSVLTYLCYHQYLPFLGCFLIYACLQITFVVYVLRKHNQWKQKQ